MSNPSALAAISYESEGATWGAATTTFATHRIPVIGAVDCSGLIQNKVDPGRVQQYRNAGDQWIKMDMAGSFTTVLDLAGHGVTMVGSPTLDAIETFLGIAFGVTPVLSATASTTLTGGTAAVPTTTASGTFSAGSLCRVGTLGDARGNGQFYAVGTHTTTSLTLLGALAGTPTNGDVLYPVVQLYPSSIPTSNAITGTRFLLQTANTQYACHGCFPTALSLTGLNTGERPQISITWGVSWWEYQNQTFPSAVASNKYNPSVVAAGSFNVQAVGTTTRSVRSIRGFTLDYTLGVVPLKGPGGASPFQTIVGATRINDAIKLTWTEDADATTTTPVLPGYATGTTAYHIEYTLSTSDQTAVGLKFPKVVVTNVPVQKADDNINRFTVEAMAYTGDTLTSDLTRAAMILGMA